jgi:hypothetical protein
MKKCRVLQDYNNDCGKKRKAGEIINLPDTSAKMRAHGGFVEILNPDKKLVAPKPVAEKKEVATQKVEAVKKPEIKMKKCKVLQSFFDSKLRKAGTTHNFTDAEANRHALARRVKIMKPRKKPAKRKTAPKKPAISSSKKSAGALAKPKSKKKVGKTTRRKGR